MNLPKTYRVRKVEQHSQGAQMVQRDHAEDLCKIVNMYLCIFKAKYLALTPSEDGVRDAAGYFNP